MSWIRAALRLWIADATPAGIALGVALGVAGGFTPPGSLFASLTLGALLALRAQLLVGVLAWSLATALRLSVLLPAFDRIGDALLLHESWKPFWTAVLQLPIVAWMASETPAMLGGVVCGIASGVLLALPVAGVSQGVRLFWLERRDREIDIIDESVEPVAR